MTRKDHRAQQTLSLLVTSLIITSTALAADKAPPAEGNAPPKYLTPPLDLTPAWNADVPVVIRGQTYKSWSDYFSSDDFPKNGGRCGFVPGPFVDEGGIAGGSTADCSSGITNPNAAAIYAPAGTKFRIPMVFHVIRNAALTQGNLSLATVQSQVVVMNQDYLALPGTNGGPGNNAQIEFFLTDDFGTTPGTGVLYYANDTWYNDGGAYYTTIAKDPFHYFNVYTNTAGGGGTLGYTTSTPPVGGGTGIGSAGDRCVILWSTIGSPCPSPGIYCLGRTLTHEAGHYFGLFHPFDNGCGTSATCYTTGDRICDTNPDSAPHFNCVVATSCSPAVPAPITNYMEYTNDSCMNNFTPEQVRRMRCDIDNYRTVLPIRVPIFPGNFTGTPNTLTNNIAVNGTTVIDSDGSQPGFSDGAGENGPPSTLYAGVPFLEPGDEVAYKINHPGGALKLTLTGLTSDVDLMLINSTGTPAGTIASSVLFGTANEKIITNAAAGTYYAVVDTGVVSGYAVYGSPFTIRYSRCVADIDNTGVVDVNDLLAVVSTWGACAGGCPPSCLGDISPVGGNCVVDVNDLLAVVSSWGGCP